MSIVENLRFLVNCHGSQTQLARRLDHRSLTQPIISSILHRKRRFHETEIRHLEMTIGIPKGWMRRVSLRKAWLLCKKYQRLNSDGRRVVDDIVMFHADDEPAEGRRP